MGTKIIWSPTVLKSFIEIQQYIDLTLGIKEGDKFEAKVLKKIDQITFFPESAPASRNSKGLRKAVITKQTSLIYKMKQAHAN